MMGLSNIHIGAIVICSIIAGFIVWGLKKCVEYEDKKVNKRFKEFMEKGAEDFDVLRTCPRCYRAFYGPNRSFPITCPTCEKGE
jgi:hypothetical protein